MEKYGIKLHKIPSMSAIAQEKFYDVRDEADHYLQQCSLFPFNEKSKVFVWMKCMNIRILEINKEHMRT
jgi:hypothetical protein